jgi:hypothetical protein
VKLLDDVLSIARGYVRGGVRIGIKTNLGPEIPVASASFNAGDGGEGGEGGGGGGVAHLLGLRAAVVVRDAEGGVISTYGEPPKTDPVRAVVAAVLAAGLVFVIIRGLTK